MLYVWGGGSSYVERYDPNSNDWTTLSTSGDEPTHAYLSCSTIVGNNWYVFGGFEWGSGNVTSNDLFILDLNTRAWSSVSTPDGPSSRAGCSLDYIPALNVLALFGGISDVIEQVGNADLWYFNLSDNTWTEKSFVDGPQGRWGHASALSDSTLVITLGISEDYRDIWEWNFLTEEWIHTPKLSHHATPAPKVGFTKVNVGSFMAVFRCTSSTKISHLAVDLARAHYLTWLS